MRRTVTLVALFLAACGGESLVVKIPTLPDATHLPMEETPPLRRYQYKLEVTSTVRKQVQLEAKLEEPAPAGVVVRLAGTTTVPREGTAWPWLVVIVPKEFGEFQGTIAITSPDLPDWVQKYTFAGVVVDRPPEGRNLEVRPPGVDVGDLHPGEEKSFAVALASFGAEDVTITSWAPGDPEQVWVPRFSEPVVIKAGGEYQLLGAVRAPRTAGPFSTTIRIGSDAQNLRNGLFVIRLTGVVAPDYAANPPRAVERVAYPVQEPEFKIRIRKREDVPPFTVAEASGYERYFEVLSLGEREPKAEQLVRLKLRRDAPTDPRRDAECQVRFRIEPGTVEVTWPVKIRLNPPIHASPDEVRFGMVPRGVEKEAEILLASLPDRKFTIKGAQAQKRLVRVTVPTHVPGTIRRVVVALPAGLAVGRVEDRVLIETDDPDVPSLLVPVWADIR